jgi:two-component system phosphate regulon sensor histidine kinase PhoR
VNKRRRLNPILVFVLAQLAWFALLGLWIYWYVSNYIIFTEVGEKLYPQLVFSSKNITALVGGLVLLVAIATGMSLIFGRLNQQLKLTGMYDNFIASVTHELKSPLASLNLYLETLQSREVSPARREEFLNLMLQDTGRLQQLINSILEIAGLEEKRSPFRYRVHSVEPLLRGLVTEAAEQYRLSPEAVEIRGRADCACRVDRDALKRVLNNLIDNAVKYSPGEARIRVTLACSKRRFTVEVADRGIGISPGDQKHLFKKFRRLYQPDSPSVKGTGLGLYWVREIVRAHRGKVSVRSRGRRQGSAFTVELPVYRPGRKGQGGADEP